MKRFVKASGVLHEAERIIKLSHSGGTVTALLNYDGSDVDTTLDTFTFSGGAAEIERLINEINYSTKVVVDADNI